MSHLKRIIFGGNIDAHGEIGEFPAVNYSKGALKFVARGLFAIFVAPLLFVESDYGFIPYGYLEGFTDTGFPNQYLQALSFNLINIIGSFVSVAAGPGWVLDCA